MNKRFISLLGLMALIWGIPAAAQISEGGTPPSFAYEQLPTAGSEAAIAEVPIRFNVNDLRHVDAWRQSEGIAPPCIATSIAVDLSVQNSGQWTTLPDGRRIWRLEVHAPGALALLLYYADFYIPEGGRLYIYNEEKTQVLGAYTTATNPAGGLFATEMVVGDRLTLEYEAGPDGAQPRIVINEVGYGYNHIEPAPDGAGIQLRRSAASCEVDINCSEGDAWQLQKRGVCKMVQKIGGRSFLCTGVLMNNTAQDLKPYIMTATHCSFDYQDRVATPADMQQWMFYFNYERTGCGNTSPITQQRTMTGCRKVAATELVGQSDGMLLLLNQSIPRDYDVYYNGWDRRDVAAQSGVSIHHPSGDVKKISTFTKPAISMTFTRDENSQRGGRAAHWDIFFAKTANGHGITESGSSGSPLYNEHRLVVGTLTGGNTTCAKPHVDNLYGKFSHHWDKYPADGTRMDRWLDPIRSGVQRLAGRLHDAVVATAPSGLRATLQPDRSVKLTWQKPTTGTPTKYLVYCDGTLIAQTNATTATHKAPTTGSRTYRVSALYGQSESDFTVATIAIHDAKPPTKPAVAYSLQQQPVVTWEAPTYEQTIYWGDERAGDFTITMEEDKLTPFYFGQRWTAAEIAPLDRCKLTAVKLWPVRDVTYEIFIRQGKRTYRQAISSFEPGKTNTVTLTNPFVIDGRSELIVSIFAAKIPGKKVYPAKCDAGPAINGKGDIYSYDGETWKTLYDPAKPNDDFNYNFFIAAVVSSGKGELTTPRSAAVTPVHTHAEASLESYEPMPIRSLQPSPFFTITGYNIYRNGSKIATVGPVPLRYIDPVKPIAQTSYQVSCLFEEGLESPRTEAVVIQPVAAGTVAARRLSSAAGQLRLSLAQPEAIRLYNAAGQLLRQFTAPAGDSRFALPAAVYIVSGEGWSEKIVVQE